ncbi:peptide ABC transporter permease [Moraxella caviae]|uniref:Inner membrane ABC transporter permease protein yejB n=1 Tax=Moraxella caviae TaxID=34060 RepID=A0A1T0A335_9GAMM|nr:ABC transporter permease subunit [Moraxella caviae]OOR90105.1 peptide ABC transporter permease [Moraxella caviae]STZ14728.1 Inner membrane ABC transporter permease protein yejB [Moraxella caviae]VEW14032.1 Inner membrane ABC transporter permease protein yejB [Moraxella caviae]
MRYVLGRLLLFVPTLLVILAVNFALIQAAPTGPLEQSIAAITEEKRALGQGFALDGVRYQGANGLSDDMLAELNARFGFDKPVLERFWLMVSQYARFDLGQSFYQGEKVATLIAQKLPITLLMGALSLVLMYGVGVSVGVWQAHSRFNAPKQNRASKFDTLTTLVLSALHAVPSFVLALLLLVLFAGGRFWQWFPMQGVMSANFAELSTLGKVWDVLHHLALPVLANAAGLVAAIALLVKFSVLGQQNAPYVLAARARGFTGVRLVRGHLLKNAILPLVAEMPLVVVGVLFSGNFLVEVVFNIDGLGRLGYEAIITKDYPVMFGVLYVFTLLSMVVQLVFDLLYALIDPRVNFAKKY